MHIRTKIFLRDRIEYFEQSCGGEERFLYKTLVWILVKKNSFRTLAEEQNKPIFSGNSVF